MSKLLSMFDAPRRGFAVHDNSDSIVDCSVEPSKTVQSEKDACDINIIVSRAETSGFAAWTDMRSPEWGLDVSEVSDYHSALNFVQAAGEQFMQLPAKIRSRFDNDPGKFLAFVEDPENFDEGCALGIWKKPDEETSTPAEPLAKPRPGAAQPPKGGEGDAGGGAQGSGA